MAATINVKGTPAHIANARWSSGDGRLADQLQALTSPRDVPGGTPDRDNWLARDVAQRIGAQVVELNPRDTSPRDPDDKY